MSEEDKAPSVGKPYSPGAKKRYVTGEELDLLTKRIDNLSSGMEKIVTAQNETLKRLEANQGTLTKVITEMRSQGVPAQAQTGEGTGRVDPTLLGILANLTRPESATDKLVMALLQENLLTTRTIRLGMMKRLQISDLFPPEQGGTGPGGSIL